jgi:uncharacterized protein YukE
MSEVVIPGSPGGLEALASQLNNAANDIDSVRDRVATNGLEGTWSGHAADAFRSSLHELPSELAKVGGAFTSAAGAVSAFAGRLSELQQQAEGYQRRAEEAERELQDANARHAEAQTKLDESRVAHSLATDPVSLNTASQAVTLGESVVRQTAADIEEVGGNISRLVSAQQTVRDEYEDAVRVCSAALDAARDSGGHALSGWRSRFDHITGRLEHDGGVLWHDTDRGAHDLERDAEHAGGITLRVFHDEWGFVRAALVDTSTALAEATLIVCGAVLVVGVALAPFGVGEAILAADAVVVDASGDVLEIEGSLILAGDSAAALTGDEQYAGDIPGDVVGVIPGDKLFGPAFREVDREMPALSRAGQRLVSDSEERLGVDATKKAADSAVKLGEGYVQGKLAQLTDWATRKVTPLISAPLENPEVLRFTVHAGAEAL